MIIKERKPYQEELDCIYNILLRQKRISKITLVILILFLSVANFFLIILPFYEPVLPIILFSAFFFILINFLCYLGIRMSLYIIKSNEVNIGNVLYHTGKVEIQYGHRTSTLLIGGLPIRIPHRYNTFHKIIGQIVECELLPFFIKTGSKKEILEYYVVAFGNYSLKQEINSGRFKLKYLEKMKQKENN